MPAAGKVELLPEIDSEFLEEKGLNYEVLQGSGEIRVIINEFSLPEQYVPRICKLMLRLPAGYPNANPDMFWTSPDVRLRNGTYPLNGDYHDSGADGWQRWSRHDNSWRGGVDNLRTKLASVRRELEKGR